MQNYTTLSFVVICITRIPLANTQIKKQNRHKERENNYKAFCSLFLKEKSYKMLAWIPRCLNRNNECQKKRLSSRFASLEPSRGKGNMIPNTHAPILEGINHLTQRVYPSLLPPYLLQPLTLLLFPLSHSLTLFLSLSLSFSIMILPSPSSSFLLLAPRREWSSLSRRRDEGRQRQKKRRKERKRKGGLERSKNT